MKLRSILLSLMAVIVLGCHRPTEQNTTSPLTGLWTLSAMEQLNPETGEWKPYPIALQGYILYDSEDNMAVHLTKAGYENTDLRWPNFDDSIPMEALKYMTGSYVYFAKYSIDKEKRIVNHARISHSNPGQWNDNVPRKYTISGDTLMLEPLDEEIPERLIWVRVE